jgi:hypothetical protein
MRKEAGKTTRAILGPSGRTVKDENQDENQAESPYGGQDVERNFEHCERPRMRARVAAKMSSKKTPCQTSQEHSVWSPTFRFAARASAAEYWALFWQPEGFCWDASGRFS